MLQPRPLFSVEVRTRSAEGLLFFAATRGGAAHLCVYLSKGRIRLSVARHKEIFNREKYNDGKWHSVVFSVEKKRFRLVVDGIRAQDGHMTSAESSSLQHLVSPVYLGSLPDTLHKELKSKSLPKQSVSGCVRNFKMGGAEVLNPSANQGAGPCFDGPTQRGTFFSGDGAHAVINSSFIVGSFFELLVNVRPLRSSGLLLHVGDAGRSSFGPLMSPYLSIYLLQGEVVVQVNNGQGEFMVSVKPKVPLCDGNFHKISVIKRKNVVQLYVDTEDSYKIGPSSSSYSQRGDTLYIGGLPELLMQQMLPVSSSLVGCLQDLKINGDLMTFDRPHAVSGPINLRECPG